MCIYFDEFYGNMCQITQDECNQKTCNSRGECFIKDDIISCQCLAEYTSLDCSTCSADNGFVELTVDLE